MCKYFFLKFMSWFKGLAMSNYLCPYRNLSQLSPSTNHNNLIIFKWQSLLFQRGHKQAPSLILLYCQIKPFNNLSLCSLVKTKSVLTQFYQKYCPYTKHPVHRSWPTPHIYAISLMRKHYGLFKFSLFLCIPPYQNKVYP